MEAFLRKSKPNLAEIAGSSDTNLKPSLRTAFSQSMADISQKLKSLKLKDFFRRKSTVSSTIEDDTKKLNPPNTKKDKSEITLLGQFFYAQFSFNHAGADLTPKIRPSFAFTSGVYPLLGKLPNPSETKYELNAVSPSIDAGSPKILKKPKSKVLPLKPLETEADIRKKSLASLIDGSVSLSTRFTSRYELGELLGDGAFGFVFTSRRIADGVKVAVKFIIKSKIAKDSWVEVGGEKLPNEVATLQRLSHPNIIQYLEHIVETDYVLLITELHGTSWDASNLELDPINNPGLKFKFRENKIYSNQKIRIF